MVGEIVGVVIVRRALAFPVVVDDQIARQAHQPVLQVPLFGVVLIQRAINSDKNFLGQIFGGVCSGGKSVGEVVNATGIVLDDLFPGRAVARATPANQFGSFANCCQSLNSPHVSSPGTLGFGNLKAANPCQQPFTTRVVLKFRVISIPLCTKTRSSTASPTD